jgi:hypothetical protein
MVRWRRTGRGPEIVEVPPERCPGGHPGRWRVSYLPCGCTAAEPPAGHRVYLCTTCGTEVFDPPHDAGQFPTTGRWQ